MARQTGEYRGSQLAGEETPEQKVHDGEWLKQGVLQVPVLGQEPQSVMKNYWSVHNSES